VIDSCWAGTNGIGIAGGMGLWIQNGDGYIIQGFRNINNGGNGIQVDDPATNVEITGGISSGCSVSTPHVGQGILFTAGVLGFRITGHRSGPIAGAANNQVYGIYISAGCDNYIITNNDTRGNFTGGINNIPGVAATRIVANNI